MNLKLKNRIILLTILVISLVGLTFLSFNKNYQERKKIKTWMSRLNAPELITTWNLIQIDKNLEFQGPTDWSYPWHVIKHKDGHFENTTGNPITKKDTAHLIHYSNCYSYLEKEEIIDFEQAIKLPFTYSKINKDTLDIIIYDESTSNSESIKLKVINRKFKSEYKISYVFPNESLTINYIKNDLTLNKEPPFEKGEKIIGKLKVKLNEIVKINNKKRQNIRIVEGTFQIIIE